MAEDPEDDGGEQSRGCVLVIDDEAALRLLIRRVLQRLGFEVLTASGGAEGVRCFSENQPRIVAVILDLVMPDLGGEAVFEQIRALRPDVPILLSSGLAADASVQSLIQRGGAYFLEKPYGRERLSELMERVLGRSP